MAVAIVVAPTEKEPENVQLNVSFMPSASVLVMLNALSSIDVLSLVGDVVVAAPVRLTQLMFAHETVELFEA